jgi:hypothetical protein
MAMRVSFHSSIGIQSGLIKSKTPASRLTVAQHPTTRGGESPHPYSQACGATTLKQIIASASAYYCAGPAASPCT